MKEAFDLFCQGLTIEQIAKKTGAPKSCLIAIAMRENWSVRKKLRAQGLDEDIPDSPLGDEDDTPATRLLPDPEWAVAQGVNPKLPVLPIKGITQTSAIARAILPHIPFGALYRRRKVTTTLEPGEEGEYTLSELTAKRAITWLEKYVTFSTPGKHGEKAVSIAKATAEAIINSDLFLDSLPELNEIARIILPIGEKAPGGQWQFSPAPAGYCPEKKMYSINSLPVNWERPMPPEEALEWLCSQFRDFPFDGGEVPLRESRSFSAFLTVMINQMLRHNIDMFPIVIVNANQPGTGKSFCCKTLLAPSQGVVDSSPLEDDTKEAQNKITSMLLSGKTYIFFDDIKSLNSNIINRITTNKKSSDRLFHTQEEISVANHAQIFATGNSLKTAKDIERRQIPIDLWYPGDNQTRTFSALNEDKLEDPAWRSRALEACWSLTLAWCEAGCPKTCPDKRQGYDRYCALGPQIVCFHGLPSPWGTRSINLDTGDVGGKALLEALQELAYQQSITYQEVRRYTTDDIIAALNAYHRAELVVGGARDPKRSIGLQMSQYKGRELRTWNGAMFRISSAKASTCSIYPITLLSPPDPLHILQRPEDLIAKEEEELKKTQYEF